MLEITLIVMATTAAIASAIAAWRSYLTSESALSFQKKFSRNQSAIARLHSIITKLRCLKSILVNPLAASDEKFQSMESLHLEIKSALEGLSEEGIVKPRESEFFNALSFAEIVDQQPVAAEEIDKEIKRLEAKINEIFD